MAKSRYIPFGYTMKDGITVIDRKEALIVQEIFNQYISGLSLKDIAEMLTERQVPYTEKKTEWNKARVARIIDNSRYKGTMDYEPIIDENVFETALNYKIARQQIPVKATCSAMNAIRGKVRCGKCGGPMVRRVESRCRIRESWICQNDMCGMQVRIPDSNIIEKVNIILNRIISNSELMLPNPAATDADSPKVYMLNNEFRNEIGKANPSEERILDIIRQIASERYSAMDSYNRIQAELSMRKIKSMRVKEYFNEEAFEEIVQTIRLTEKPEIIIHTKTNTEITGENDGC